MKTSDCSSISARSISKPRRKEAVYHLLHPKRPIHSKAQASKARSCQSHQTSNIPLTLWHIWISQVILANRRHLLTHQLNQVWKTPFRDSQRGLNLWVVLHPCTDLSKSKGPGRSLLSRTTLKCVEEVHVKQANRRCINPRPASSQTLCRAWLTWSHLLRLRVQEPRSEDALPTSVSVTTTPKVTCKASRNSLLYQQGRHI